MDRLRVAELNDSFPPTIDGVAQTVKNYATILQKNHCDVTVVTPKYPGVEDNYDFEVYRYQSIPLGKRIGYRAGNPFSPETLVQLRKKNFDLLHVHAPFASSLLAAAVNPRRRHPTVLTYHTKFEYDIERRLSTGGFQFLATKFMLDNISLADEVWAVTDGCGKALQKIGYKGDYYVMENGTDFPFGRVPDDAVTALREKLEIPEDAFVFLFVGRMMWYKNVRISIDALKMLKKHGVPFRAIMIGGGLDLPDIEAYAAIAGLEKEILFTGPMYDRELLRVYYCMADCFLFPSTYDTSGIVVKEAAACECPSLMIAESCASEGAINGKNALLAEENAEACGKVLLDACQSRDTFKTLGKHASKDLYLSWDTAVERAYRRYEEILKTWPGPLPYNSRG